MPPILPRFPPEREERLVVIEKNTTGAIKRESAFIKSVCTVENTPSAMSVAAPTGSHFMPKPTAQPRSIAPKVKYIARLCAE